MLSSIFSSLSDAQQTAIFKALAKIERADLTSPEFYANELVFPFPGAEQVSITELANNPSAQNDVNISNVFNKILKPLVTSDDVTLFVPIEIGVIDDDNFVLTSGHHRLTAILTLIDAVEKANGLEPESLLAEVTIPVLVRPYHPALLSAGNQSRSMGLGEKTYIALTRGGVDASDLDELIDAASRNVPGALLRAAYVAAQQWENDDDVLCRLTDSTVGSIARSAWSKLGRVYNLTSTKMAEFAPLFIAAFPETLREVLRKQRFDGEGGNIARNANFIGACISKILGAASSDISVAVKKSKNTAKAAEKTKLTNTRVRKATIKPAPTTTIDVDDEDLEGIEDLDE